MLRKTEKNNRHSRMFLAGIYKMDARLKHSGMTTLMF